MADRLSFHSVRGTLVAIVILAGSGPSGAVAQRGRPANTNAPGPSSPTTDFQGLFDTNVPPPGVVTVALPSIQLDVGVTERWSLGLNLGPFTAAGLARGGFGFGARTRYLVVQSPAASLSLDGVGFLIKHGGSDYAGAASTNLTVRLGRGHELQAMIGAGVVRSQLSEEVDGLQTDQDGSVVALLASIGYAFAPADWVSFQLTLGSLPFASGITDSVGGSVDLNVDDTSFFERTMFRPMVYFRAGSAWLFEIGAYILPVIPFPIPWLGASVKIG